MRNSFSFLYKSDLFFGKKKNKEERFFLISIRRKNSFYTFLGNISRIRRKIFEESRVLRAFKASIKKKNHQTKRKRLKDPTNKKPT
jgi:hypothetical protein